MKFRPDREAVRRELEAHMEDRRADFLATELTEQEAEAAVVRAMGDAKQVGKLLNKAHAPLLGYAWLLSKWLCILLVISMVVVFFWESDPVWYWNHYAATIFGWQSPCACEVQFEEFQDFETRQPVETGLTLREGAYRLTLDHGFYYINPIEDGGEQYLTLAFRIEADRFWQIAPQGFENDLCAVDDQGSEYKLEGSSLFQVDMADVGLPVWMMHVRLFIPYDGPLNQREWFRFYVPDTEFAFTVWTNGEVSM